MTDAEEVAFSLAVKSVRDLGQMLREVAGLRQLAERHTLHRRPDPIRYRPKRQYRPPAQRTR